MESLFAQRRYQELREVASRYADMGDKTMSAEVSETIDLWAGRGTAA